MTLTDHDVAVLWCGWLHLLCIIIDLSIQDKSTDILPFYNRLFKETVKIV